MSITKLPTLKLEIRWCLASYRVCRDCIYAIETLQDQEFSFVAWRVQWAGICSLLKTSVHLLRTTDSRSCLPKELTSACQKAWNRLLTEKQSYPLFWEFINRERNNILKEYEFSAYLAMKDSEGRIITSYSLLTSIGMDQALLIKGGKYDGKNALEVAANAAGWLDEYIHQTIRNAGLDPKLKVNAANFAVSK